MELVGSEPEGDTREEVVPVSLTEEMNQILDVLIAARDGANSRINWYLKQCAKLAGIEDFKQVQFDSVERVFRARS